MNEHDSQNKIHIYLFNPFVESEAGAVKSVESRGVGKVPFK